MTDRLQIAFSSSFSSKENVILTKILLNEICSCAQQTLHPYNLDNGLAPNSYRTIVWTNNGLVYSSF